jgi:hypothetical protein
VNADPSHAQYVTNWAKGHRAEVADWIKQNPGTPQPQPSDLPSCSGKFLQAQVRTEIDEILQTDAFAPLDGLVGEKMINVVQVNLELTRRYGAPQG